MKIKKILNKLIFIIPIIITACNSNKNNENLDNIIEPSNSIQNVEKNEPELMNDIHDDIQDIYHNNIIYFDLGKYDINSDFKKLLDMHANFLIRNPLYKVTIEGHTDEEGTQEYNINLGELRANAIKTYLQNIGVSSDQISTISYGKEKLIEIGNDEISHSKNRRAVLVY